MRSTSEQEELRAAVRGLLDRCDPAAVSPGAATAEPRTARDALPEQRLWQRMCGEIGVAGLAIPERYGGSGAGPVEVHIVMEELGRALTASPMLGSAVLSTQALLTTDDQAACARLLPALASGTAIAALAWTTAAGNWHPAEVACRAQSAGRAAAGGWQISGEAHYVLDGGQAAVNLVPARMPDGGIGLFEVQPGQPSVTCTPSTTMDDTRRLAVLRFDRAPGARIGDRAQLGQIRDLGCVALSAEQVGAAARALALTVAYTKDRVQFGRPIASFQALQHRMADLYVRVQSARSVSYAAAEAAAMGAADLPLRAATAKAYCSEVLQQVSAEMIQLHGAIGMTWEHQAHRYFKRAHSAAMLLGTPAEHVARIAAAVVDG
ncbi:MAG: acyl-CoA dehydrogenase family protein [Streptosporangiaceae bacterium]